MTIDMIFKLLLLITLTACNNSLSVSSGQRAGTTSINLDRLSAKPGEVITITGTNLTDDLEVLVNGEPAVFHRIDDKTGTIEMPADMESGLVRVSFSRKSKSVATIPLMNGNSVDTLSPMTVPLESICDSYIIKTAENELVRGKADCTRRQTICSEEGQSDCKTTANVPAVVKADLADKVVEGQTVAGVSGNATAACED